jgi:hypothetical protein
VSERRRKLVHALLVSVPLLFLLADWIRVPVLRNGCTTTGADIHLRDLQENQFKPKGSYRGHSVFVSLDAIQDSEFLNYVTSAPTALVIAIDHDSAANGVWGGLTRAVLAKLDSISPSNAEVLREIIPGAEPTYGRALSEHLHIPADQRHKFPVDYLYVMGMKIIGTNDLQSRQQRSDILARALQAVMAQADRDGVENLVIPSVGVDPRDPTTLQYSDFYPVAMSAVGTTRFPGNIYFTLYRKDLALYRKDLPHIDPIHVLQQSWSDACSASEKLPFLVREDIRLALLALFVCLVVCSKYVPISLKNFLIIAVGFLAAVFGMSSIEQPMIGDWPAAAQLFAHIVVLLAVAVLFPFLPRWNYKEIFDTTVGNDHE